MSSCSTATGCCSSSAPSDSAVTNPALVSGTQRFKWSISGMHCGSCAAKLEKALQAVEGVQQASVAFSTERLLVELDASQTMDAVIAVVDKMGYTLEEAGKPEKEEPFWKSYSTFILLAFMASVASILYVLNSDWSNYGFYLATSVGIIPFARKALTQIKNGTWFGIETLMTVAALGALALGETVEAVLVLFLFSLGEMLEGFAGRKAKSGIKSLMQLAPDTAFKIQGSERLEVPAEFLVPGELIEVRPGDRLPVDATLQSESGLFNESALTGESMPVNRERGEKVMAGSLVVDQPVRLVVVSEPGNNAIDRIITLIEEAEERRAPIARLIDNFSAWYTPLVMAIATLVMVLPPLLLGAPIEPWAYKALTLLLIACPCALVVSIPAAVTSALAAASRFGALVKGGAALEQLRLIKRLAFDKTGTLTQGKPQVTTVIGVNATEEQVLSLAAAIEQSSSHPLARAIIGEAGNRNISVEEADHVRVLMGRGIEGVVQGKKIRALAPRYVQEGLLALHGLRGQIETLEAEGNTVVVLQDNNQVLGLVGLADTLREDAVEAITRLREIGVDSIMLTGDNRRAAAAIAGKLGIEYRAELLPEDKVKAIAALQAESNGAVAMVGDGINDAPALKTAELGIAMGRGSDVALETADAALTHERLVELANMIGLSKKTARITRQNIALALGINALFLVTTVFGMTGLMAAVISDAGGTVLVTLNALRLMSRN